EFGDRRRDLPVARASSRADRRVEPGGLHHHRTPLAVGRALLRRGEQPVRRDRRTVPLHARRLRRLRRLRGRVDAVVRRAASQASIMAAMAVALGYYFPALTAGFPRALFLAALTIALAGINASGVRQGAIVVNGLTVAKLAPLAVFIIIGFAFIQTHRLTVLPAITIQQALAAGLLLIFIYGGYEVVPVPAGEAVDPRRDVPFAMVATIVSVVIVMTLVQVVAQGVLPNVADHATPIADAAAAFLGVGGALLIGVGSVVSMTGTNMGHVLSGSRIIFALAERGQLPAALARIHPRFRTPVNAIVFTSAVALALAVSGSFVAIAVVSVL